ncbi:MAG: hypothetical protein A2900_05510 [Candidatus Chisholmbacteria bacterium RIFCSPLOWO2_01_FULL_50_28]|uniref:Carboxypeptidase regulatory-like domain-containing protein n=1 Tax=Candidatus Chisholmbacteria bacterium RIFCSPHIGHO2_01_FULL_52_32 TaxID=1797591 RepID=A0A1G1VRV0_9BACT|nr:MAG: hypothetical protein A2786_01235 [Candidatus Chisholmbacteria bacterium RIFCSPHIGHO2_01_FULL_52_32]OGY20501.1 MAG: hypothetical protein A2900_05510 [Candidatus Chisholmbacteria bacterium RIFCSPLOWO2_01_FULL_50_28]
MKSALPHRYSEHGQSLIEALVGLGILIILFHAFGSLIIAAYDLLGNSRTRITARQLGNEKIEQLHNLPYASLGVVGGIPQGVIPQQESVDRNGLTYTVRTAVIYIDDPFDQVAPSDLSPADYKRIRVDVSWTGRFVAGESVTLVTDIASNAAAGGGTLAILVFDSSAQPVSQADVTIVNNEVSPPVNLTLQTADDGRIILPGAPTCTNCYQITATKTDFSTDRTYSSLEVTNPAKPHATLIEGQVTEVSFAIDHTSTLIIFSKRDRDFSYGTLPNQIFTLRGGKTIGFDSLGDPVPKYNKQLQTAPTGTLSLSGMEWDSYQLTIPPGAWDLAGTNPLRPVVLYPNTSLDLAFASAVHSPDSLLLAVTDASGSAIASASAHLTGPGNFDETIFTGEANVPDFGQAFFSPLSSGNFTAQITKEGFMPKSDTIEVSGQTESTIQLDSL